MFDKNTVVRALDCCSARPMDCDICPYEGYMDPDGDDYPNCKEKMMIDAMVLLKGDENNEQV